MTPQIFGIVWYRRETYAAVKALFKDGGNLPDTYDSWLAKALAIEQAQKASGRNVVRAYLDPDQFPAFCALNNLDVAANGRAAWANFVAMEVHMGRRKPEQ